MKNLTEQPFLINREKRNVLNKHKSFLIWFTGLSGSGKSTLANLLEVELFKRGMHTYLLDGDNVRLGLNKDLTFTQEDRAENLRRIGEISKLMVDAGLITLASFISPFEKDRQHVKDILGSENYIEIYLSTPLEECIKRDVKGLYQKAKNGEIKEFTGISSPYEIPQNPNLEINAAEVSKEDALEMILEKVLEKIND